MPSIAIKLDVDAHGGFDALHDADGNAFTAARIVHLGNDAQIEVGTHRGGMESGKDSVAFCFSLPDGRVVVAETSADLFLATARAIIGWQEGRKDRGES